MASGESEIVSWCRRFGRMFPVVSLKPREGFKGYNSLAKETEVEGISL